VDIALAASAGGGRVFTMGPLIHNPQVLETLQARGIGVLDEGDLPASLEGVTVVIRAHGIPPALEARLRSLGASLEDATCLKVKASQEKARAFAAEGRRVFLAGEKDHGEIIGIQGYAPGCLIAADRLEAERAAEAVLAREGPVKAALIAQTTLSPEEYAAIGEILAARFPDLVITDTICLATRERQEALRDLCGQVDAVVVAGGRTSANTRRLFAIAEASGKPAVLAERPCDIPPEFAAYPTVGLSAGASTPDDLIEAIERRLISQ